ncbi:secreted RxLR effector protein 161-like [Cryptomeria japonica]|uniref:secreted RxLR effector protein 161-like n=1 Tax=Cryptomeria japonica TaxID=3369 RepID=UPI0027D9F211|nr:secreted RxLR effector protein 161-like [Cryptomeria japonica]
MSDCKQLVVLVLQGTKFSIEDCPKSPSETEDMAKAPYASAIGKLMYAMICTRPYIAQEVGVISQFMENLRRLHWGVVKRVFRCLKGCIDSRISTSGYVFTLNGGAISWMSKRQVVFTLSSTEAEYMAATHACQEAVWLKHLCLDAGFNSR